MGDAVSVEVLHGQAELSQELPHHALRQTAPCADQLGEVSAAAQLHRDVYVTANRRVRGGELSVRYHRDVHATATRRGRRENTDNSSAIHRQPNAHTHIHMFLNVSKRMLSVG